MSWFGGKKKQKQKQYSGFPGDCSQQQLQTLAKFKAHVQSIKKVPLEQFNDVYLLRFLRARKFDLQKTVKMWNDFIDWRVKHSIDNYHKFKFPELPALRKMYPHGYHKVDKQFRPIYIERVGFMDVDKIFKVMEAQNLLNYYALLYETLLTTIFDGCTQLRQMKTGQTDKVTQTITILDLKHVKLGNASKAYDFVKPVSAMAQNNYPEILGNMFIVNAPMLFTGIWTIVKMWIDDKTKQKIKILGSSYKKQLLEYIEPENLPAFLDGGKCTCGAKECVLEANIGPWNPEGKDMLADNINMIDESKNQGFLKEQVLLSSPDVLVEVEVNNKQIVPVVAHSIENEAQEDEVLKKVMQLDLNKQNEAQQKPAITQASQTEQKPQCEKVEEKDEGEKVEEKDEGEKVEEKKEDEKVEQKEECEKVEQKEDENAEQKEGQKAEQNEAVKSEQNEGEKAEQKEVETVQVQIGLGQNKDMVTE